MWTLELNFDAWYDKIWFNLCAFFIFFGRMTRLPSASTYHQRVWYNARTEEAEKCIRWSFDGFVLLPNFSQSLGAHANPQQPTILILVSWLQHWHWCPDYNTDTDVLIADPLSAGDEKLVLLLSPDSPSSPHYAATHSVHVHHLLSTGALVQSTRLHRIVGKPM